MTARRRQRNRRPKASAELRPFKIVGKLIGAQYNEHGEVVGEVMMGDVAIYRTNFGKVKQLVDQAFEDAKRAEAEAES
jgi:hypothetical protein